MATLLDLEASGDLFKLDAGLEPHEQEWRRISISPTLRRWIEQDLPKLEPQWLSELTPLEQFDDLAYAFVSGEPLLCLAQFKPLRHVAGGIWELKTPDLRVFGWFNFKDSFVGVVANQTNAIKKHRLYHGHAGEVADFRNKLALEEPKFVPGEDPYAVVSDFDYP